MFPLVKTNFFVWLVSTQARLFNKYYERSCRRKFFCSTSPCLKASESAFFAVLKISRLSCRACPHLLMDTVTQQQKQQQCLGECVQSSVQLLV